jgi:hypothetical protein
VFGLKFQASYAVASLSVSIFIHNGSCVSKHDSARFLYIHRICAVLDSRFRYLPPSLDPVSTLYQCKTPDFFIVHVPYASKSIQHVSLPYFTENLMLIFLL